MARKRAAGGGRKPRGNFADLAATISVRMRADMRTQLEASKAQRNHGKGWSLTQEILHRLQLSFDRERDERRDPASRALCYLLAEIISAVANNTADPSGWRSDPFAFRTIKLAFAQILEALEPKGEIRAPEPEAFAALWGGPGGMFTSAGKTPEDMAHFIRDVILMRMREAPSEPSPINDGPLATVSQTHQQQEFEFGMSDAIRHLRLTGEQKS